MKFEFLYHSFGGEEFWYHKAEKWAKKQGPVLSPILLGIIDWLKEQWVETKIQTTLEDVDRQAKKIVEDWSKDDPKPIITSRPSEVEGLDIIEIRSPWSDK